MAKPDPRIFELACQRLDVSPAEAIMVDDRAGYVLAAQDCGLKGIVYANLADFKRDLQQLLDTDQ